MHRLTGSILLQGILNIAMDDPDLLDRRVMLLEGVTGTFSIVLYEEFIDDEGLRAHRQTEFILDEETGELVGKTF